MAEGMMWSVPTDEVVEKPVPPLPMCVGGSREEWDEYHRLAGIYNHGLLFFPEKQVSSIGEVKCFRVMTPEARNKVYDEFVVNPPVSQYRLTRRVSF